MIRSDDPIRSGRDRQIRAVMASMVGSSIEWYDFFLYGTAAALVFPKLFFSADGANASLIESFTTIFIGFLARPIGAAVFGHIGDKLGRRITMVSTLSLMGVSTLLIGLLPTQASWGAAAGYSLVLLRFLQGLGVGGDWGGSVLMALETHSGKRQGLVASLAHMGVPIGFVLSIGANRLCSALTGADYLADGWRYPFVAGAVLLAVGLVIRLRAEETPAFAAMVAERRVPDAPVMAAIRGNWREILLSALIRPGEQASFYILSTFVVFYGANDLGLGRDFILNAVLAAALVSTLTLPFFGWLSDVAGRRRVYLAGALGMTLFAFPFFGLLDTRQPALVVLGVVLALVIHDMMYGPQAAFIAESFPARIRCSGASLGYQCASIIAGGPAPLVSIWLYVHFHSGYAVAAYLAAMGLVSAVAGLFLGRSRTAAQTQQAFALPPLTIDPEFTR
ncbi:MFS transporter [Lichenibacterium minor]|uniref:MFS transporter n=1 Tax=Lichenibacterium minor TaxID=2316528 RepID=A0A4Q2U2P0_9HYPH|nr:MFS transporter [Lichenibacterium minor]RYC29117.1 MFS transporter [Lichenibacterium minor]